MSNNLSNIEKYVLPNGDVYTGQCRKRLPFIELKGIGELRYMDGRIYKGQFDFGRPYGIGKLYFNGISSNQYHYGVFDGDPNGIGLQNWSFGKYIGFFEEGLMNGWGIRIYRNNIIFGWWEEGKLIKDYSLDISWVIDKLNKRIMQGYCGNMFHVSTLNEVSFYYGIAPYYCKSSGSEVMGIGIRFCNNGSIIVGEEAFYDIAGYKISGDVDIYINHPRNTIKGWRWENGKQIHFRHN